MGMAKKTLAGAIGALALLAPALGLTAPLTLTRADTRAGVDLSGTWR